MSLVAPPIDARVAADIERQLAALLKTYAPGWSEVEPATGLAAGTSAALTGVFSRFAEITLQRLNQALDKNQLAFLDLLGATLLSPQPARVPLTFSLAPRAAGATVPARTQIAAPPNADQPKGVVFETERELAVTPASLARIVNWDGPSDTLADCSQVALPENAVPATLFCGATAAEHAFYIAQDECFGFHDVQGFSVTVTLAADIPAPFDPRELQWELWDGATATPIAPSAYGITADGSANLTTSGQIWFMIMPHIPRATVAGVTSRWLRCRLLTPITTSTEPVAGFVRISQLPVITALQMDGVGRGGPPALPDAAFFGNVAQDVSKDFYPFGADAKFGATCYLASGQVLSVAGRQICINVTLTDPATGIAKAGPASGLTLKWEYWTGAEWTAIGTSTVAGGTAVGNTNFFDFSYALTASGAIGFVLDAPPQPTRVNGIEDYWMRVRIAGGGYQPVDSTKPPVAPSLTEARLYYDNSNRAVSIVAADALARSDGAETIVVQLPFAPFVPAADTGRSLYLGFAAPAGAALAQAPISLFVDLAAIPFGTPPDDAAANTVGPQLAWSYWDGRHWNGLAVADDTAALTLAETLQFLPPADLTARSLFASAALFWLRASWVGGSYKFLPRLRRALLNTVMAQQATTVMGEILGSSSASASQSFTAAQTPIFDGVALDVIEDGVRVRWREVTDFLASGPRDRDFMLDHLTGAVRFGDGIAGMVPPGGTANVQLSRYRSGVGAGGDAAVGSISQLKTTVPYIASATNWLAAAGGVAGEDPARLRDRAPRLLRHGGRAVTVDDFQDLACLASPEVARALCVPLCDLSLDPDGLTSRPGTVSVIIVPNSADAHAIPSVELVERTQAYLDSAALPCATVVVVGPEYVTVSVLVEAGLIRLEGASAVQAALQEVLAAFLHPLTGGTSGQGWDFGRRPHRSDLFRLLQSVSGVDHIAALVVTETPDRAGTIATGRFLVCSGVHRVDLRFGNS